MTLCPVWTEKMVKVTTFDHSQPPVNGRRPKVVTPTKKMLVCGCKVAALVRVHYRELSRYRRGEGKYDDVFGLCLRHLAALSEDAGAWNVGGDHWRPGAVSGLRGLVERVEVRVPTDALGGAVSAETAAKNDKALRVMASFKADFKRKMRQSNASFLSVDNWRQLFGEIVDEWVAEEVMDS